MGSILICINYTPNKEVVCALRAFKLNVSGLGRWRCMLVSRSRVITVGRLSRVVEVFE
jgi:hypothetical protein